MERQGIQCEMQTANIMRYPTWLAVELWEAVTKNINVLCMGQELAYHLIVTLISGRCQSKKILQCWFSYYFNWNRLDVELLVPTHEE